MIALCNMGLGETVIKSWKAKKLNIYIDLKCGDSVSGYVHIRKRHQIDWQKLIDFGGGGGLWDDLMVFAVGGTLTSPAIVKDKGSNKWCYSAPLTITRYRDGATSLWNPTVFVSKNNKKIITAFPSRTSAC